MKTEIVISLVDPVLGISQLRGTYDGVAKATERVIREGKLIDGSIIVKWFEADREAHSRNYILLSYIADVMREVLESPQVESAYPTVDVYAIAKHPRRNAEAR